MRRDARVPERYSFFFNDTATTEIYTLSLHDALPIWGRGRWGLHEPRVQRSLGCAGAGGRWGRRRVARPGDRGSRGTVRGPRGWRGQRDRRRQLAAAGPDIPCLPIALRD